MAPKRRKNGLKDVKIEQNTSKITVFLDPAVKKRLQLHYICGFCEQFLTDDAEKHIALHEKEITFCNNCCISVKPGEKSEHLMQYHKFGQNQVKFELSHMLIEARIQLEKSFSNFWGALIKETDKFRRNFGRSVRQCFERYKSGRYLGIFRFTSDSQLAWSCPLCDENQTNLFQETIGLRVFVLNHYEQFHRAIVEETVPGFLDFEWYQLAEETDFDVKSLIAVANQRLKIKERGYKTFYTLNLAKLTNGTHFRNELEKRTGCHEHSSRFCLICCRLVAEASLKQHFTCKNHFELNAVSHSTAFTFIDKEALDRKLAGICDGENEGSQENPWKETSFRFPEDLFEYTTEYKNLRVDEFKWRCCLCPRAHANTFTTPIILRMYALRHIDQNHRFLFTDEFLQFEWQSLRHEMGAAFDLRSYTPQDYTIRGENTFNKTDANDYVLPQQGYFLPKHSIGSTLICGFCYRSLNRNEFLLHVVFHGFGADPSRSSCDLKKPTLDPLVKELMGQNVFNEADLDDEPHNVLSIEGKRLKTKMTLLSERNSSSQVAFSDGATPVKSEFDGEEVSTPRRKSAMDARRVLSTTFKVLEENMRNMKSTWNESSSSSSDESNSEDDRFEETMMNRRSKSRSREDVRRKNDFCKMKPKDIRRVIKENAKKRGMEWKDSESDSDSTDSNSEDVRQPQNSGDKWKTMKPKDIQQLIRQAAKRRKIEIRDSSSSDSDDSSD